MVINLSVPGVFVWLRGGHLYIWYWFQMQTFIQVSLPWYRYLNQIKLSFVIQVIYDYDGLADTFNIVTRLR